jgi:hypothetical protein
MQRDDWYSSVRDARLMSSPEAIGRYAAERALARLNARSIDTRTCPVLFEAPLAAGLLGAFVQATSGGALYRKSTFLLDSLGKQVLPKHMQITEDPHIIGGVGSAPFDEEGVRTVKRDVVKDGVVQGYFLSTYSARKLGMQTTGNAGGSHNLSLTSSLTRRRRLRRHAAQDGHRPAGDGADGAGHQLRDRRLFARRGRLLGREWRDPVSGGRNHHRRQYEGHAGADRRGR